MPWTPGSNGPDGGDPNPWGSPGGPRRPGGGGPWGGGPGGGGPNPIPDLDALIARLQAGVRGWLPGGRRGGTGRGPGGILGGGRMIALLALVAVALWLASGFYRVEPDQQGVVLRFGAFNRTALPGLNYHLPWPIETALTPAVTRINRTEVGYRSGGIDQETGRELAAGDVPAESLMLTGDENIIDINLTVFWRIRDAGAYLFITRHPDATVKSVAESVVREVIGRTPIEPALTGARARIEQDVTTSTQKILDQYGTGIEITQVQLQRVDPPAAVIDAFRDVQRATTDAERMRNEAESYHNDIVPRARGDAARIVAEADGARQASIAEATGQAQRFLSVLQAYQAAKAVTLRRLYIEAMQGILSHDQSLIVDDSLRGLLPVLPLGLPGGGGGAAPPAQPAPTPGAPTLGALN
ncbi:MAG: FtsH protease activity modulator HflK [Acetobacteraceae bacterium]|nr:FtsH protease activity modulator HflK [Acetobacteraceae bacterium]